MPTAAEPARPPVASVGTTERLRRNNLSNILSLVHQSGPLSRAQLTRMTGLNRSTVGAVVADRRTVQSGHARQLRTRERTTLVNEAEDVGQVVAPQPLSRA